MERLLLSHLFEILLCCYNIQRSYILEQQISAKVIPHRCPVAEKYRRCLPCGSLFCGQATTLTVPVVQVRFL